eukprot:gene611-11936_t
MSAGAPPRKVRKVDTTDSVAHRNRDEMSSISSVKK